MCWFFTLLNVEASQFTSTQILELLGAKVCQNKTLVASKHRQREKNKKKTRKKQTVRVDVDKGLGTRKQTRTEAKFSLRLFSQRPEEHARLLLVRCICCKHNVLYPYCFLHSTFQLKLIMPSSSYPKLSISSTLSPFSTFSYYDRYCFSFEKKWTEFSTIFIIVRTNVLHQLTRA